MGDGVEAGRHGQRHRQGQGQLDIVEHDLRQYLRRALRRLPSGCRFAENRSRLGAGIGRRDDDLRQVGPERDRLAQPCRRAAAERDHRIGVLRPDDRQRLFGHADRRVHGCLGEGASAALTEISRQCLGASRLLRRREYQRASAAESTQLLAGGGEGTGAKDDPLRLRLIDERIHRRLLLQAIQIHDRKCRLLHAPRSFLHKMRMAGIIIAMTAVRRRDPCSRMPQTVSRPIAQCRRRRGYCLGLRSCRAKGSQLRLRPRNCRREDVHAESVERAFACSSQCTRSGSSRA